MSDPAPGAGTATAPVPGRTSEARERILATADRLFYNEGIHAVGIQLIVAESDVTRVTLYRHFPSKDDLISAYLGRRAQYDHDQVDGIIAARSDDPRTALTELATALTRDDFGAVRRGCPFINASAEFTGSHPARVHALRDPPLGDRARRGAPTTAGAPRPSRHRRAADDGPHRGRRLGCPGRERAPQRRLPHLLGEADRRRAATGAMRSWATTMRTMPALRGLRGSVVGLSAAGLGIAGHAMAGGVLPGGTQMALVTAGLVLLGIAMSRRPWGLPSLLTVLIGAQVALHVVLADTAHAHSMAGMSHQGLAAGLLMTFAHLVAATVTALLLRQGERWCQALVELLGRSVRAVRVAVLPLLRFRQLPVRPAPASPVTRHLAHSLSRRGPPLFSLA